MEAITLMSLDRASREAVDAVRKLGDALASIHHSQRRILPPYERELEREYRRVRIMLGDE